MTFLRVTASVRYYNKVASRQNNVLDKPGQVQ